MTSQDKHPKLDPNERRLPGPMIIVFTVLIIAIIITLLAIFVWE